MTSKWLSSETQHFSRAVINYFAIVFSCNSTVLNSLYFTLPLKESNSWDWARQVHLDIAQQLKEKCIALDWTFVGINAINAPHNIAYKFWKSYPDQYVYLARFGSGLRICFDESHYKDMVFDFPLKCYNVTDIPGHFNRETINISTIHHFLSELKEFLKIPFQAPVLK